MLSANRVYVSSSQVGVSTLHVLSLAQRLGKFVVYCNCVSNCFQVGDVLFNLFLFASQICQCLITILLKTN